VHCTQNRADADPTANGAAAGSKLAAAPATDWTGCYAEYAKRDVRGLFPLASNMQPLDGALVEPLAVSVHAVRRAAMKEGAKVAVLGAGTIGLTAVLAARAMGASEVFVTARHAHQAALAKEMGATHVLPESPAEANGTLQELTHGQGADLVIETVGGEADTVNLSFDMVKRRGTVAFLGIFAHPMPVNMGRPLGREATVIFPLCYGTQDGKPDFQVAIDLMASGKANVQPLATHRFSLSEAPQAFNTADDKSTRSVKVLLFPE
jgi:threonine dehydrogenase-like Zn-dependent dehydrogenase